MSIFKELGISGGKWEYDKRTNNLTTEHHDQVGQIWNDNNGNLIAQAPRMFYILIEWCLSVEATGGLRSPKYILSKNLIEEATGKTWEEIKELIQ